MARQGLSCRFNEQERKLSAVGALWQGIWVFFRTYPQWKAIGRA
jgi:hypothetical protein